MTRVYLSLGSNIDREKHIIAGLESLQAAFGALQVSPVYRSGAVGFDGDDFYNLVVGMDTDLPLKDVAAKLRQIEDENGRIRNGPKFSSRTLDIDILTFGDACGLVDGIRLPRDEIGFHAFVLKPLADIAPDDVLPGSDKSYRQLWQDFSRKEAQPLEEISLPWR